MIGIINISNYNELGSLKNELLQNLRQFGKTEQFRRKWQVHFLHQPFNVLLLKRS